LRAGGSSATRRFTRASAVKSTTGPSPLGAKRYRPSGSRVSRDSATGPLAPYRTSCSSPCLSLPCTQVPACSEKPSTTAASPPRAGARRHLQRQRELEARQAEAEGSIAELRQTKDWIDAEELKVWRRRLLHAERAALAEAHREGALPDHSAERLLAEGDAPGCICGHRADRIGAGETRIMGGKIVTPDGDDESHADNRAAFILDVEGRR
jgi:hypothetical protein